MGLSMIFRHDKEAWQRTIPVCLALEFSDGTECHLTRFNSKSRWNYKNKQTYGEYTVLPEEITMDMLRTLRKATLYAQITITHHNHEGIRVDDARIQSLVFTDGEETLEFSNFDSDGKIKE